MVDWRCLWTYDITTRNFCGIVVHTAKEPVVVKEALRRASETILNPGLLVVLLCERLFANEIDPRLSKHHSTLLQYNALLNEALAQSKAGVDAMLSRVTQNLSKALDEMLVSSWQLERFEATIQAVTKFDKHLRPLLTSNTHPVEFKESNQRLTAIMARVNRARSHGNFIKERAQAYLRTVKSIVPTHGSHMTNSN